MPYMPVNSIESVDANKWELTAKLAESYKMLKQLHRDTDTIGLAGIIGKLPSVETLRRSIEDKSIQDERYTGNKNFGEYLQYVEEEKQKKEDLVRKHADEIGTNPKMVEAVSGAIIVALHLFEQRMNDAHSVSTDEQKNTFETILPLKANKAQAVEKRLEIAKQLGKTPEKMFGFNKTLLDINPSSDPATRKEALADLNDLMKSVNSGDVPDKVRELAEAVYTMATAPVVLSFEEARAKVKGQKLPDGIPKRGGNIGEKGV